MNILHTRLVATVFAIAVIFAGCGRGGSSGTAVEDVQTGSTASTIGPDENDGGDDDDACDQDGEYDNGGGVGGLSWLPFGPASPDAARGSERRYAALWSHNCSDVGPAPDEDAEGYDLLYRGLRQACSALYEGQGFGSA